MKHVNCCNIVFVLVLVFVVNACQPNSTCKENMETGVVCQFNEAYLDETDQIRYRTTWDSITVIGINQADSLYANKKGLQKITLPLRKDVDSTHYCLIYHNLSDTLTIHHNNEQRFVSVECGCNFHHELRELECTHHWVDSIAILDTAVTRAGLTNICFLHFSEK